MKHALVNVRISKDALSFVAIAKRQRKHYLRQELDKNAQVVLTTNSEPLFP